MTSKCKTIKCRTPQYTRLYAYVSAVLLTEGGVPIPPLLEIMTEYAQDPPLVSNWFEMRSSGTDYYSSVNSISVFSTVPLSFLVSDNCIRLCNAVSNNVSLFSGLSKSMADGFSANHSIVRPKIMVIKNGNVSTIVGTDHAGYGEGVGSAAKLYCPTGMALTSDSKSLIVCDKLNNLIRMVNLSSRQTSSLAGDRNPENRNGRGSESAISNPAHCVWNRLTTKPQTELFITSMDSIRILNVTTNELTILKTSVKLDPYGIDQTPSGHLVVTCSDWSCIYLVDPSNGNSVRITGSASGERGTFNGDPLNEALFSLLRAVVVVESECCLAVVDGTCIRKVPLEPHLMIPPFKSI